MLKNHALCLAEGAAVPAPELLREAGRRRSCHVAVLTYSFVRSAHPIMVVPPSGCTMRFAAFPSRGLRAGLPSAKVRTSFEYSLNFFVWLSCIHMRINRKNILIIHQPHIGLRWFAHGDARGMVACPIPWLIEGERYREKEHHRGFSRSEEHTSEL